MVTTIGVHRSSMQIMHGNRTSMVTMTITTRAIMLVFVLLEMLAIGSVLRILEDESMTDNEKVKQAFDALEDIHDGLY